MSVVVVLDSGPLGLLSSPDNRNPDTAICKEWMKRHLDKKNRLVIPAIADYETRRELLRNRSIGSVRRLDYLVQRLIFVSVTDLVLRRAAELWAELRQRGLPTTSDDSIDADVILAAQAQMLGEECIVATSNPRHLARMVDAADWKTIIP